MAPPVSGSDSLNLQTADLWFTAVASWRATSCRRPDGGCSLGATDSDNWQEERERERSFTGQKYTKKSSRSHHPDLLELNYTHLACGQRIKLCLQCQKLKVNCGKKQEVLSLL